MTSGLDAVIEFSFGKQVAAVKVIAKDTLLMSSEVFSLDMLLTTKGVLTKWGS